jgi:hypothetical protein
MDDHYLGPLCPVCLAEVPQGRHDAGLEACSRRCERVADRIASAKASGDQEKLDRAVGAKRAIFHARWDPPGAA